jgi:hypothetical protein
MTSTPPDWEKIKKEADAERAALESQKQLHDARESLKAVEASPGLGKKAMEDKLAGAKAAKELAESEKAIAESRKAQADTAFANLKAQIGEVPMSGFSGDVKLDKNTGITEAALLAAKAAKTAANKIAEAIKCKTQQKSIMLYAAGEVPNFQELIAYRVQISMVRKALTDAISSSADADNKVPEASVPRAAAFPMAAVAGLTLDAVNKLFGFFRADYAYGGVELKVEDTLLVQALAEIIANTNNVYLPAIYSPAALSDADSTVLNEIISVSQLHSKARDNANRHDTLSLRLTEEAGSENDAERKTGLLSKASIHKTAAEALKSASLLYDGIFNKLTTADVNGLAPLGKVISEDVVAQSLQKGNLLLILKVHNSGGAYYTEKSMFTFIGGMALYHMGGIVASYVLLEGKVGNVLAAGVVPVHGGFVKAGDLQKELNNNH